MFYDGKREIANLTKSLKACINRNEEAKLTHLQNKRKPRKAASKHSQKEM